MKTTSFEISKRLADIGFKAETSFLWVENLFAGKNCIMHLQAMNVHNNKESNEVAAYDLETILEALPDSIHDKETSSFEEFLELDKHCACYNSIFVKFPEFSVDRKENESLADTAARLLILLREKGLIKFEE